MALATSRGFWPTIFSQIATAAKAASSLVAALSKCAMASERASIDGTVDNAPSRSFFSSLRWIRAAACLQILSF